MTLFTLIISLAYVIVKVSTETDELMSETHPTARKLNEVMLYLSSESRKTFFKKCVGVRNICSPRELDTATFHWGGQMSAATKHRFWKTYECVYYKKLQECPVDGSWSLWSEWSSCPKYSTACNYRGTIKRTRQCTNPEPQNGGLECTGLAAETYKCIGFASCNRSRSTGSAEAMSRLKPVHLEHWFLKHQCLVNSCTYATVLQALGTKREATSYWSSLVCYKYSHGCPIDGGWSSWQLWKNCSSTCGHGQRLRQRKCSNPAPENSGEHCEGLQYEFGECFGRQCNVLGSTVLWSRWSHWTQCDVNCDGGIKIRSRGCPSPNACIGYKTETMICNMKVCPVNGEWAQWNAWSTCLHTHGPNCGIGVQHRVRTCTEPAPAGEGNSCVGMGSDTTHCFTKPCTVDATNIQQALFNGDSILTYPPSGIPTKMLMLMVRLRPLSVNGIVMHRMSDNCHGITRTTKVILYLSDLLAVLEARIGQNNLRVFSREQLKLGSWNTILATISGNKGIVRVNDGEHNVELFENNPSTDVNYDMLMTVGGANTEVAANFQGAISLLRVNYRPMDLKVSELWQWQGHGTPITVDHVNYEPADIWAFYPAFHGREYTTLPVPTFSEFHPLIISLIFYPHNVLDGLILFNKGHTPGSYMSLAFDQSSLKYCLCIENNRESCAISHLIQINKWYLITISTKSGSSYLKIDNNTASEITPRGDAYRPTSKLYVGGGESYDWAVFSMTAGESIGFTGLIQSVRIGDRIYDMKRATLIQTGGKVNSFGATLAVHYREIHVTQENAISLYCDYTKYVMSNSSVPRVIWLRFDFFVRVNEHIRLVEQEPGVRYITSLHLDPTGVRNHNEGFYSCMVHYNGDYILAHVFGVSYESTAEAKVTNIVPEAGRLTGLLVFVAVIACAICLTIVQLCWLKIKKRKFMKTQPSPDNTIQVQSDYLRTVNDLTDEKGITQKDVKRKSNQTLTPQIRRNSGKSVHLQTLSNFEEQRIIISNDDFSQQAYSSSPCDSFKRHTYLDNREYYLGLGDRGRLSSPGHSPDRYSSNGDTPERFTSTGDTERFSSPVDSSKHCFNNGESSEEYLIPDNCQLVDSYIYPEDDFGRYINSDNQYSKTDETLKRFSVTDDSPESYSKSVSSLLRSNSVFYPKPGNQVLKFYSLPAVGSHRQNSKTEENHELSKLLIGTTKE